MSLGETVRVEPAAEGLMAVKAEAGASQDISAPRPAYKLAPESNELLLFKSAAHVSGSRGAGRRARSLPAMDATLD